MKSRRTLLGWVLTLAVASAVAQAPGVSHWRGDSVGYYGLRAEGAQLRLGLQAAAVEPTSMDRILALAPAQGLNVKLAGLTAVPGELALFGRVASLAPRNPTAVMGMSGVDGGGLSYGVGLSWDFSRRGSATLGWDNYDFRSAAGERDVRATSLGLQWRY